MTPHRRLSLAALAAVFALGACTGPDAENGDTGSQGSGATQEEHQGTILNDTTPHRPGAPGPGVAGSEGVDENEQAEQEPQFDRERQ